MTHDTAPGAPQQGDSALRYLPPLTLGRDAAPFRYNLNPGDTIVCAEPLVAGPHERVTPGAVQRTPLIVTWVSDDTVHASVSGFGDDGEGPAFSSHLRHVIPRTPTDEQVRPWQPGRRQVTRYETPALLAYQQDYLRAVAYLESKGYRATTPGGEPLPAHATISVATLLQHSR